MKPRCAYRGGYMRKKPTNLTLSDDIRARAARLMVMQSFSSFSTYVEHLIRNEHARQFPNQVAPSSLNEPANVTHLPSPETTAAPVTYRRRKGRKK